MILDKHFLLYKDRVIEIRIEEVLCVFKNVKYYSNLAEHLNVNHITLYNPSIGKLNWDISGKSDFYPEFIYGSLDDLIKDANPLFKNKNGLLWIQGIFNLKFLPKGTCLNSEGNLATWKFIDGKPELIKITNPEDSTQNPFINLATDDIYINKIRGYSNEKYCKKYKYDIEYYY